MGRTFDGRGLAGSVALDFEAVLPKKFPGGSIGAKEIETASYLGDRSHGFGIP
jgi:hypothetical protein